MVTKKLNRLVVSFKEGDNRALEELAGMFLPIINRQSESIWHSVESQTKFECRCLIKVKRAIKNFNPEKGSLRQHVISAIMEERRDFLSRRGSRFKDATSLDEPLYTDGEGNEVRLEVPDVLANVEEIVEVSSVVNEKVALLAKGDSRRLAILKAWTEGCYDDTKLSRELALTIGGNARSHCRFIQRFRTECQQRLADEVTI
ncbi:hypothetical protein [Bacillus sp. FSL K6-3431]|uniref:hypothetical protein n=1 Tax=Bacillus sp. FSL K6-3431 TaxID=2921500 RepID=UPI0030FC8D79